MKIMVVTGDDPDTATLVLRGELDLATTAGFEARSEELVAAGRIRLVVDLSELTFCDSIGLNGLVRAKSHCEQRGGWLRVSGTHGQVAHVIGISGLLEALAADD